MPASIRQQVQLAAAAALGGKWGIPAPQDERQLPWTSLDNGSDTVTSNEYDSTELEMSVVVSRAAAATSSDLAAMQAQANALLADIHSELVGTAADRTLGGLADDIEYRSGDILTGADKFVFGIGEFVIKYRHLKDDPYTIE